MSESTDVSNDTAPPAAESASPATESANEAIPTARTRRATTKKRTRAKKPIAAATRGSKKKPASPRRARVARFIVLFRHGLAEDRAPEKLDADRSLTADGHAKTKRAARGLEEIFPEADTLFSSPLVRAMQTALWLTKAYRDKLRVQVTDALLPDADPKKLADLIAEQDGRNIIVVGHEPHLTEAFAQLVGISRSLRADLKKAGCIGIRLDERGQGTLEFMLSPRMLRRLD